MSEEPDRLVLYDAAEREIASWLIGPGSSFHIGLLATDIEQAAAIALIRPEHDTERER